MNDPRELLQVDFNACAQRVMQLGQSVARLHPLYPFTAERSALLNDDLFADLAAYMARKGFLTQQPGEGAVQ